jgi:hypothetical protein
MVRAIADELLETLADLLGRAVDTGGVGPRGVVVDDALPAMKLIPRDLGPLVDREKHALRDRKRLRIAPRLLEVLA